MKNSASREPGVSLPPLEIDRARRYFVFESVFAIAMTLLVLALTWLRTPTLYREPA